MSNNQINVAIVTNTIANYRVDFYQRIIQNKRFKIKVYCQNEIKGMNLKLGHQNLQNNIQIIKSVGLTKEKLGWQFLPIINLYRKYDVIFFYGNPRILSNVVSSILLKLFGKRIVIWGQAHTAGANPKTERIRLLWWRLFDYLFLYTENEIKYLRKRGFNDKKNIIGMNNGLNQDEIDMAKGQWDIIKLEQWRREHNLEKKEILLSCARLEEKNQFILMIYALKKLIEKNDKIIWCVIGQGKQADKLQDLVNKNGLTDNVIWLGPIYEEVELAPWFMSSTIMIHPGAIGLSLLHAFGYGLPVITHDNYEYQMPEIAALKDGINGLLFKYNNYESLTQVIEQLLSSKIDVKKMSLSAYQTARNEFNTLIMSERFLQIAEQACNNKKMDNK